MFDLLKPFDSLVWMYTLSAVPILAAVLFAVAKLESFLVAVLHKLIFPYHSHFKSNYFNRAQTTGPDVTTQSGTSTAPLSARASRVTWTCRRSGQSGGNFKCYLIFLN